MFVALRDLRFAKGRFALMGTVVVLITLLVTMLSGLTAGLARENVSAIEDLPADHVVFAAGGDPSFADSRISESAWRAWRDLDGVRAERLGVSMARLTRGDRGAAAAVFAVQPGGSLAPRSLRPGTVVLSEALAGNGGPAAGDVGDVGNVGKTVRLLGRDLTVAGTTGPASYSHAPVAWIAIEDWAAALRGQTGPGTAATVLALRTGGRADLAAADARLGTVTVPLADASAAIGSYTSENGSLQLMRGLLFAISALVIGAFFTVWTIQRRGDVAVLKALGAGTGYLLRDALAQAVIVLLLGAGLGGLLGAALGALAEGTVPFVLSATTTVVPVAVMVVLGAAGAALAIRKITSVDPLTALGASR
ncbi:FtsX-like permease family protein [Streptosporangium pseudovulgare]|uniref:ABC transporter substrate-binding protein n=1 Tax=Streptosporangium pseudovulgare TaxID=35765 RepID=A0ABQ2R7T1_9ACTN|nr:FtsX-like permease family protein [Streptosporangium pseudovulgare]GGQ14468.1 ABC transporter substrate-binding protein [Streptosporangium pseudovulgare]